MATNDLCSLLSTDVKIDEVSEQKICTAVLKQLGRNMYVLDIANFVLYNLINCC